MNNLDFTDLMSKYTTQSERKAKARLHLLEFYNDHEQLKNDTEAAGSPARLIEGGCLECYTHKMREFLKHYYNETEQEAERYTDSQVFKRYKDIMSHTIWDAIHLKNERHNKIMKLYDKAMHRRETYYSDIIQDSNDLDAILSYYMMTQDEKNELKENGILSN